MPKTNGTRTAKLNAEDEFKGWRERLYKAMSLPKDGKIAAFAAEEKVSREWVRMVLDGTYDDVEMLHRCVAFLERWNEEKARVLREQKQGFVQRAAQSHALAV